MGNFFIEELALFAEHKKAEQYENSMEREQMIIYEDDHYMAEQGLSNDGLAVVWFISKDSGEILWESPLVSCTDFIKEFAA